MLDIEGPDTVTKHYNLLSALLRVICAALLSRGAQNELSLEQGRRFLTDNKLSTMAVFKKSAGLGSSSAASEESVLELVEVFVVLINVTGYLDVSACVILQLTLADFYSSMKILGRSDSL